MALKNNILSFWKQVKLKSSDMFTLFRVGVGVKVPKNKLHVKDSSTPLRVEGLTNTSITYTPAVDYYTIITDPNGVFYRQPAGAPISTGKIYDADGNQFLNGSSGNTTVIGDLSVGGTLTFGISSSALITVPNGGTGATTFTSNAILTGNGTSAIQSESTLTYFGEVLTIGNEDNGAATIKRTQRSGSNLDGGNLQFIAGFGTGSGGGGDFLFLSNGTNATATSLGDLQTSATLTSGGNLTLLGDLTISGGNITNAITFDSGITNAGTIAAGTWNGTAIAQSKIADQAINEAKLQVSNAPTNGYMLTAQSGDTGGLTWAAAPTDTNTQNTTTLSFVDSSDDILLRNTTGGASSGTDDIKFVAGSNVTLTHTDADSITISSTDTNTTYSIQDGELSQNNFTDADHTKLNNIEDNATADQTKGDIDALGIAATTAVSLTAGDKIIDGNLGLGGDDGDSHYVTRVARSDNDGGRLYIQAGAGGGTNKPGGSLLLQGGASTGNANGGSIVFTSSAAGSSGSSANSVGILGSINSLGLSIEGDLTVKGNDIKDDDGTTCITFDSSGNTTVSNTLNATLTGNVTGNASTSTILETARAINGVDFNGSAPITITAAGSTLSDTVPVSKGGTGATSFADKAVIITQDSGTDTLAAVTMSTNGQLLIGGTDGPAVATLTQGNGLTITNANGAITLAVNSDIDTSGESGTVDNIGNLTGDVTSSNRATTIANDAVTYAKMQDVSATNVVLGRDSAGAGVVEEISAANLRTILNVADGATADQTNVTGSSGSCTGNAATATALTTGNKDITGTLGVTELITSKQRHLLRCGFYGNASKMYLPFNYGGTFENTSTAGYSEYGAVIMPCDGYVESVIIRSENACGNSSVTILVASDGTEVPSLSPGSFVSPTVNMSADDTSYKFTGFVNQGGTTNSFSAGDVIMIAFDPTSSSYDTTATAVLVFDWNNQL